MLELSERQKEYLSNYAPEVSRSGRFNIKAAIKRKLMGIDYFLIDLFNYPNSKDFTFLLEKIKNNLEKNITGMKKENE